MADGRFRTLLPATLRLYGNQAYIEIDLGVTLMNKGQNNIAVDCPEKIRINHAFYLSQENSPNCFLKCALPAVFSEIKIESIKFKSF